MPTFIDEGGEIGVKATSARHFRLVAVCFESEARVNPCVQELGGLIPALGLPATFEFHFSKNTHNQKTAFFSTLSGHDFSFVATHFDKDAGDRVSLTQDAVRYETLNALARRLKEMYRCWEGQRTASAGLNERILYDECQDPSYEKAIKTAFAGLGSSNGRGGKLIRSIKSGKSKAELRLQIADMVCGAVGLHLNGDSTYYDMIRSKEHAILVLPK